MGGITSECMLRKKINKDYMRLLRIDLLITEVKMRLFGMD